MKVTMKRQISVAALVPLAVLGAVAAQAVLLLLIYFLERTFGPLGPVLFAISLVLLRFKWIRKVTLENKWAWADAARSVGLRLEGKDVAKLVETKGRR